MARDEAIRKHRAMWRWIAEQIESRKEVRCIPNLKHEFCCNNGDTPELDCYYCEYTRWKTNRCGACPLEWPGGDCFKGRLYQDVVDANNWKVQARIARKIAELPERDEE